MALKKITPAERLEQKLKIAWENYGRQAEDAFAEYFAATGEPGDTVKAVCPDTVWNKPNNKGKGLKDGGRCLRVSR